MFSIKFGPMLTEVKTLISMSCAVMKYHTVRRYRIIGNGSVLMKDLRRLRKKKSSDFSLQQDNFILLASVSST